MFKNIFIKYLSAFALIIFISFIMQAVFITFIIKDYSAKDQKENLEWTAMTVSEILANGYENGYDNTFEGFITDIVSPSEYFKNFIDRDRNLVIVISDMDGNVLNVASSLGTQNKFYGTIGSGILSEFKDGKYEGKCTLSGVLSGNYTVFGSYIPDSNDVPIGIVFACRSNMNEDVLISDTIKMVVMTSLWVMLAAVIAVYFITDRMIQPLRSMIGAAKNYAKGDFKSRVPVVGKDEVAELATAFNDMADSLDHLEYMRNSFLASVSHDLRTPMTTISGFIDGINSGAIPPEKQEYYLGIISSEVHRLSRLVSQLLDISRLESGDRKFNFVNFDICEMARLILISFEQKIENKKLDVIFDVQEDSMLVYADKDAIYQVFYNLCDNAIKFANEGGKFRIGVRRGEQDKIIVSVFDEGKGISAEDLPYIFDRFYKSDKSRGLDKVGVGLGLYISKTIIDAHGEHIGVKSVNEQNCEFIFTLKPAIGTETAKLS